MDPALCNDTASVGTIGAATGPDSVLTSESVAVHIVVCSGTM